MNYRKSTCVGTAAIVLFAIFGFASISLSSEYFPLEEGIQWTYTNDVQGNTGPATDFNGSVVVPLSFGWPMVEGRTFLCVDDPSGPFMLGLTVHEGTYMGNDNWFACSWTFSFETAVRLFELPLTPGAELIDIVSTDRGELLFRRTVGSPENLETPYGELQAYPIHLQDIFWGFSSMLIYVHEDLGVVGFNSSRLISVTDIVAVEELTWGGVKSLYR